MKAVQLMSNRNSGIPLSLNGMSRLKFIAGIGASTAALTGCLSSGDKLLQNSNLGLSSPSLADLMRRTGVVQIQYQGLIYNSDGTIVPVKSVTHPALCSTPSPLSRAGRGTKVCADPSPAPPPVYVNYSFATFDALGGISLGINQSVYGVGTGTSPVYRSQSTPGCNNPIPDAQEIATQMMDYINTHASSFSAAIGTAASNAVSNWQGTGLGVAASVEAAMEFMGVVFVGVSFSEVLVMLAACGLLIATIYEVWECFNG